MEIIGVLLSVSNYKESEFVFPKLILIKNINLTTVSL